MNDSEAEVLQIYGTPLDETMLNKLKIKFNFKNNPQVLAEDIFDTIFTDHTLHKISKAFFYFKFEVFFILYFYFKKKQLINLFNKLKFI